METAMDWETGGWDPTSGELLARSVMLVLLVLTGIKS
jgi:hypothetical protein